jgi:heterodisulfide reductase subunit A-like polyferredoxin
MDACTACGDCIEACPVSVPSEFNQGLDDQKATYKRYAQAYPQCLRHRKAGPGSLQDRLPGQS